MAEPKAGEPFGLDAAQIEKIDWNLAVNRIIHDMRTDFIYAPHLGAIYRRASRKLIDMVSSQLKNGTYNPGIPLTIEVPKSFRFRIAVSSGRLGPNFSRPGSILLPSDRLLYQALADQATELVDDKTDHGRSFSHKLADRGSASMFMPTRICWNNLQRSLRTHAKDKSLNYAVKIDISNCFGSINQHTMVNLLTDYLYPKSLANRLDVILTEYTGDRSSRGILQGIFPSDLFGNFYMAPVDRFLDDLGVPSARYVDDIYAFVPSVDAADSLVRDLIPFLRSYDLVLNEAKCVIMPKSILLTEEPDLEELFNDAVNEISDQVDEEDFDADYGFQSEWADEIDGSSEHEDDGDDNVSGVDLELAATQVLFDAIETYPGQEENIERFCLPLFSKVDSDYAVGHVRDAFRKRPSMSQIYASYLSRFLDTPENFEFLASTLDDRSLGDWQKMWCLAALLQRPPENDTSTKSAVKIASDGNRHDALRAVAAIYVGRHGDMPRRKSLISLYPRVSPYVQAAIYYSSRYWPSPERSNAKANWGTHGINPLLTFALSKMR